jgi:hypothetical protein
MRQLEPRPRDEKDAAQDLADMAGQLASLKGEGMALRPELQHPQAQIRERTLSGRGCSCGGQEEGNQVKGPEPTKLGPRPGSYVLADGPFLLRGYHPPPWYSACRPNSIAISAMMNTTKAMVNNVSSMKKMTLTRCVCNKSSNADPYPASYVAIAVGRT